MTTEQIRQEIREQWGEQVLTACDNTYPLKMTADDFLECCTACGGDWVGMLLSGIQNLYPEVYEAIPKQLGDYAWQCANDVLILLGIDMES